MEAPITIICASAPARAKPSLHAKPLLILALAGTLDHVHGWTLRAAEHPRARSHGSGGPHLPFDVTPAAVAASHPSAQRPSWVAPVVGAARATVWDPLEVDLFVGEAYLLHGVRRRVAAGATAPQALLRAANRPPSGSRSIQHSAVHCVGSCNCRLRARTMSRKRAARTPPVRTPPQEALRAPQRNVCSDSPIRRLASDGDIYDGDSPVEVSLGADGEREIQLTHPVAQFPDPADLCRTLSVYRLQIDSHSGVPAASPGDPHDVRMFGVFVRPLQYEAHRVVKR
jgi:hypothetical protein